MSLDERIGTGGNSDAIDQVCTLFTEPGEVAFIESPTYHLGVKILPRPSPRAAPGADRRRRLPHPDGYRRSVERRYAAIGSRPRARSIAPFGCAPMTAAAGSPSRKRIIVGIDITP